MNQSFIDRSVRFQLGDLEGVSLTASTDAFGLAQDASSGSTLFWNSRHNLPYGANGWYCENGISNPDLSNVLCAFRYVNREKHVPVAASIVSAGLQHDFAVDMQDRRVRNLVRPDGTCLPVISFNRVAGARGRVLWPLPIYHDLGSGHFLGNVDPGEIPWEKKKNVLVWRGITGGRVTTGPTPADESIRLRALLKKHKSGAIDRAEALAKLGNLPRWAAVTKAQGNPHYDFGFVNGDGYEISETPFHEDLAAAPLTRVKMQGYKYLAVLRGLDVGSSFYWTMNSGSVGFVMETPFESFGSVHFKPWEHYIPFKQDLSNLDERFDWACSHDAECREMTRRASAACQALGSTRLRNAIQQAIVDELNGRVIA